MATTSKAETVDVIEVQTTEQYLRIVGTSPLIMNRMSQKVRQELLLPKGRKTAAAKQSTLKHNPYQEFRDAPDRIREDTAPTYLAVLGSAFKAAMCTAALDIPGARKTQIGRLVYVHGHLVGIYGEPQIFMAVTRSADMNRTPDIRTRAILPQWACELKITHVSPILQSASVRNLLAGGGITSGIGDWRPEKGKGTFGQYRIAGEDDAEYALITQAWGRESQIAAMAEPVCYDAETEELLSWFNDESKRRGFEAA